MNLRCLIVDDEPLALDILKRYISETPDLELLAECGDAFEALKVLSHNSVDLLFLDINMSGLDGISLLKSIEHPPEVIFTTAYSEFAAEAFELSAIDYLVKPFGFERFLRSVDKARGKLKGLNTNQQEEFLLVKDNKRLYTVKVDTIQYVEALGDFVKIYTENKVYITSGTLKEYMNRLSPNNFIQCHKSYIVCIAAIKYLDGNQVSIGEAMIPIGQTFKQNLLTKLTETGQ